MTRNLKLSLLLLPLWCSIAMAEVTPSYGQYDPRVRVIDYNEYDVVVLKTFYGVQTHIKVAEDETVLGYSCGDDAAWSIEYRGRHAFVKPTDMRADTNLSILTDKRIYHFSLQVQKKPITDKTAWKNKNLIYSLSFRYPEEEAKKRIEAQKAEQKRLEKIAQQNAIVATENTIKQELKDAKTVNVNYDYWVAGSELIAPTAARDDGRFTYLTFGNNKDFPAVFEVAADGSESIINTSVDGNVLLVHKVVSHLMLRKGKEVSSVVNKAFTINSGRDNTTGTISKNVKRVVKEE